MSKNISKRVFKCLIYSSLVTGIAFASTTPAPAAGETKTIGGIASKITESFKNIGKLIFSIAYVAGLGFGVAAIFKFKQHKDNPTQVPIGTPIALIAISSALVFLPGFYSPLGKTMGLEDTAGGFTGGGVTNLPGTTAGSG